MALKNRNKGTAGNFRAAVVCPNCGTRCLIESSHSISPRTREFRVQCQNMRCGWTGVATMEIIRTLSPPPRHNTLNVLPPEVEAEYFERSESDERLF